MFIPMHEMGIIRGLRPCVTPFHEPLKQNDLVNVLEAEMAFVPGPLDCWILGKT